MPRRPTSDAIRTVTRLVFAAALALPSAAWAITAAPQGGREASQPPVAAQQPVRPVVQQRGPVAHPEDAAARVPLEAYIRGHATGDAAMLRRAFLKDARLWWVRDGQVATRTTEEYIASTVAAGAASEDAVRRVVTLEISGESATATIEVSYPTARYTDYVTLLKVGDEWWIASKAYLPDRHHTLT